MVLCKSWYVSHSEHAASSLSHDKAVGLCCVVTGATLDQELTFAMAAMMLPVSNTSGEDASSSSVGAAVRAARDGGETHAGGPRSVEYSGWMVMSLSIVCSGTLVGVCLETGESYLLESVSAVTFFLPGTWSTLKRNIIALSLKLSSRGL